MSTVKGQTTRKRRCVYERGGKVWHIIAAGPKEADCSGIACDPGDMIVFPSTFQTRVPTCPDCLALPTGRRSTPTPAPARESL